LVCVGVEDSWAGEKDEHDEDEDRNPDQDPIPKPLSFGPLGVLGLTLT
jgi:hypothetical protein